MFLLRIFICNQRVDTKSYRLLSSPWEKNKKKCRQTLEWRCMPYRGQRCSLTATATTFLSPVLLRRVGSDQHASFVPEVGWWTCVRYVVRKAFVGVAPKPLQNHQLRLLPCCFATSTLWFSCHWGARLRIFGRWSCRCDFPYCYETSILTRMPTTRHDSFKWSLCYILFGIID